ncbi:hypothetical protein P4S72_16235 [Vibrio sp. PP-XX7]
MIQILWFTLALFSMNVQAKAMIPGFELVHTVPVETGLVTQGVRDPVSVWCQQFDEAHKRIDIARFM